MCHPTYHKSQAAVGGGGYYSEGWTHNLVDEDDFCFWWIQKTDRWNRVSSCWMKVVMAANGRVSGFPRMKKNKIRKSQAKLERCRGMFGCREIFNNKGSVSTLFLFDVSLKWPRASFLSCLFFSNSFWRCVWPAGTVGLLRGEEEQEEGGPFLIFFKFFFSLRCAFLFGGRQDKCFCPPPTSAKMDIFFFFWFRLPSREKSLSLLFSYPRVLWGLLIQIKEEQNLSFKGLLGSLGSELKRRFPNWKCDGEIWKFLSSRNSTQVFNWGWKLAAVVLWRISDE